MTNSEFIDDKKIKDILTYISAMKHATQIRMMFLCSLNGMRSINFAMLQIKDCYTDELKPKDAICLGEDKNKGKHKCVYYFIRFQWHLYPVWAARISGFENPNTL